VAQERGITMTIKRQRNIFVGATQDSQEETIIFEYDKYEDYSFPKRDVVPDGWYYAFIEETRPSRNAKGEKCFDVFYKLLSRIDYWRWYDCQIDFVEYYYMKQRYKVGSTPASDFSKAMRKIIGVQKTFSIKDVIGCMDAIRLEYRDDYTIGSIMERKIIKQATGIFNLDADTNTDTDTDIDTE
jgi:hypothetical protein